MNKLKFTLGPDGTLSEQDAKRYFSTVGLATFALMLIFYVGNLGLGMALSYVAPTLLENAVVSNLLSIIPLYLLAFPVFWLILRRLPRDSVQPCGMGTGQWLGGLCVAFALMMAGNYIGNLFIVLFESALGRSLTNPVEAATSGTAWWINLIFMAIVAPILEELVFRKVLCDRLLPLGEGYTVVLSAVIFGLVHGNFFQFFYAFLLGMLFALIYVKTGRIRYTVLYHAVINLLGGVFASWLLDQVEPLMQEETLEALTEAMEGGNVEAITALIGDYMVPLLLMLGYELLIIGASIVGIVLMLTGKKKLRLERGLLPPPQKGRVGNVLLNGGVAAALTVFAIIFVLSLL